ncbi:Red chlorophyll catabolite reductase [Dillenia turbinata]|uniref:Red chlorophyll catabolite reductase n=1 Tax=Dillenia turbinata TaxID=194707 RepID=A0AAN8Z856_9MAGN
MEAQEEGRRRFMEFPYVSGPHRDLMVDLVSTVETRLGSQLRPCTLPQDVQFYQNQTGSAQASLQIRSGDKSSPKKLIVGELRRLHSISLFGGFNCWPSELFVKFGAMLMFNLGFGRGNLKFSSWIKIVECIKRTVTVPMQLLARFPAAFGEMCIGALTALADFMGAGIDFTLGSWLHCELPSGGALNITSLSAYLRHSTDAPNFLFELIQSTPTSFVLILDLPPRKDLVLHLDYLKNFYEETQLDKYRQQLEKLDEVQPYFSSSLYIRSVVSPTAILVRVDTKEGGGERLEEIIEKDVHPVLREVVGVWLDKCACGEREVEETERSILKKRDQLIKNQTIEIDLGSSFPRLFGEETASRVLGAIRGVFNSSTS